MTRPTEAAADRVRVPADVERPDRLLGGLTARQLAILAVAAVVLWAGYAATRRLVPPAAYAVAAIPIMAAAVVAAVGRIDGASADRFLLSALAWRRSPRRLVPAGEPIPAPPGLLAGRTGPVPAPLRLPLGAVADGGDGHGVVDLGPDGRAVICQANAGAFALRTPAEQEGMVAGFARFLNSLAEPAQILVRSEPVELTAAIAELEDAAPGLPHPALEVAARGHARFLGDLAGRGLLSRQVLVTFRQPASGSSGGGDGEEGWEELGRRAADATAALAAAGVALRPLDPAATAALLARAADPAARRPVVGSGDDVIVMAASQPHPDNPEGDLW